MTEKVGAADVRQRLSKLLDNAAKGERYIIMRAGKPVAVLGPVPAEPPAAAAGAPARRPSGPFNDKAVQEILGRAFPGKKRG